MATGVSCGGGNRPPPVIAKLFGPWFASPKDPLSPIWHSLAQIHATHPGHLPPKDLARPFLKGVSSPKEQFQILSFFLQCVQRGVSWYHAQQCTILFRSIPESSRQEVLSLISGLETPPKDVPAVLLDLQQMTSSQRKAIQELASRFPKDLLRRALPHLLPAPEEEWSELLSLAEQLPILILWADSVVRELCKIPRKERLHRVLVILQTRQKQGPMEPCEVIRRLEKPQGFSASL